MVYKDLTTSFHELTAWSKPISPEQTHIGPFLAGADAIKQKLMGMEALIQDVRIQYLESHRFIRSRAIIMSEQDKNDFESDIMDLIKDSTATIEDLQLSCTYDFQQEIIKYLMERLKTIANTAKQLQSRRYKQPFLLSSSLLPEEERLKLKDIEMELKRKIDYENKHCDTDIPSQHDKLRMRLNFPYIHKNSRIAEGIGMPDDSGELNSLTTEPNNFSTQKTHKNPSVQDDKNVSKSHVLGSEVLDNHNIQFSEEELRQYQAENVQLHRHFEESLEDAKKIEMKMTEISTLMGQFADKVVQQHNDIEMIHHHAQETTNNVRSSGKILEHTLQIGQGYGFYIFCFYLGISILLQFFHFFN